jgi:hypothetical protein
MSESVWQKPPLRACAQNPQHRLDKAATCRHTSHPDTGSFLQERCQLDPLFIAQLAFVHTNEKESEFYLRLTSTEPSIRMRQINEIHNLGLIKIRCTLSSDD